MTHSVNAPFPPPTATQSIDPPSSGTSSTKDAAKNEAANVKDTAVQAGGQVASTAADQAKEVAQETKRQAQDLLQQGRSQVREQAVSQQQKAAQGLSALAEELRGLATGSSEGAPGPARDLLEQASDKVEQVSSWLQDREPADLLDEVRRFARQKPGMFLLGAAAAGVLAGRMARGVKDVHSDANERNVGGRYPATNYVDPAPAYTGTAAPTGTTAAAPLPPPPYGTVPPAGTTVPPTTPAGWDDPARRPGEVR